MAVSLYIALTACSDARRLRVNVPHTYAAAVDHVRVEAFDVEHHIDCERLSYDDEYVRLLDPIETWDLRPNAWTEPEELPRALFIAIGMNAAGASVVSGCYVNESGGAGSLPLDAQIDTAPTPYVSLADLGMSPAPPFEVTATVVDYRGDPLAIGLSFEVFRASSEASGGRTRIDPGPDGTASVVVGNAGPGPVWVQVRAPWQTESARVSGFEPLREVFTVEMPGDPSTVPDDLESVMWVGHWGGSLIVVALGPLDHEGNRQVFGLMQPASSLEPFHVTRALVGDANVVMPALDPLDVRIPVSGSGWWGFNPSSLEFTLSDGRDPGTILRVRAATHGVIVQHEDRRWATPAGSSTYFTERLNAQADAVGAGGRTRDAWGGWHHGLAFRHNDGRTTVLRGGTVVEPIASTLESIGFIDWQPPGSGPYPAMQPSLVGSVSDDLAEGYARFWMGAEIELAEDYGVLTVSRPLTGWISVNLDGDGLTDLIAVAQPTEEDPTARLLFVVADEDRTTTPFHAYSPPLGASQARIAVRGSSLVVWTPNRLTVYELTH